MRVRLPWRGWAVALAAILALALPVAAQTPDPPTAGTMPEDYLPALRPLLAAALKQSPRMIASQLQVAVADAQRLNAGVSPLLPHVAGSFQIGEQASSVAGNSSATVRNAGYQYSAGLSQALFQWGALKNGLEVQKIAETITEKNYAEGYRNFVTLVRRQYLSLIANKIALRNARFGLKLSQDALAADQDRLKHGMMSPGDLIAPGLDVDERQLGVDRAAQAYDFARRTLAHEIGMEDLPDDQVPDSIPLPKYSPEAASSLLAALLRNGARDTFQAEVQELNVKSQKVQYNIAKVNLLPKLSANIGVNEYYQSYAAGGTVSQTALLNEFYWLQAQWNIFDGFATRGAKLEALNNRRYYERELEITAEQIMDEAQNSRRNLDFSARALDLAERRRALAEDGLRRTREEFKLGNFPQDSLNASIDVMNQNEYGSIEARADFLSAWSDFVSLVGADPAMQNLPARYVRPVR